MGTVQGPFHDSLLKSTLCQALCSVLGTQMDSPPLRDRRKLGRRQDVQGLDGPKASGSGERDGTQLAVAGAGV